MKLFLTALQAGFVILTAPLLSGIIRKMKNNLRMRKGAGILQPYYNFFKLLGKEEVISDQASWIFTAAPYAALSSSAAALLLVPSLSGEFALSRMGDFLTVIFLFSLGRFFIALAGLDTGSSFGGMGSSREMFISSIAEPAALLSIFAVSLTGGTTGLIAALPQDFRVSSVIAALSLFLVTIAETSRLPVDNQETHLELTMVHEAMTLEYSGRSLAVIELANHIKQAVFFILVMNLLLPVSLITGSGAASAAGALGLFALKMLLLCLVTAVLEVSIAKARLFRVLDFYAFAFILSFTAMLAAALGY